MWTLYGGNYIQCLPEIMCGEGKKNNSVYILILNSDIDWKKTSEWKTIILSKKCDWRSSNSV